MWPERNKLLHIKKTAFNTLFYLFFSGRMAIRVDQDEAVLCAADKDDAKPESHIADGLADDATSVALRRAHRLQHQLGQSKRGNGRQPVPHRSRHGRGDPHSSHHPIDDRCRGPRVHTGRCCASHCAGQKRELA